MKTSDRAYNIQDRVYTTQKLSRNLELTPEGYLLCKNASLARTGQMDYGPREVPDEMWTSAARDGRITIDRFAEDVFATTFLDSLNGKSVVIVHPDKDVDPWNWKRHEVGVCLNPRRGTDADSDFIVGDLLIKDADAIKFIRDNMPEISLGYEADYQEYETGKWKQVPLIGNHIALVDSGRCGPQCAVRDTGDITMRTNDKSLKRKAVDKAWYADWRVRLNGAIKTNDQKAIDAIMDEAEPEEEMMDADPDENLHIHLPGGEAKDDSRLEKLEGRVDEHDSKHSAHDAAIEEIKGHLGLNSESGEQIGNDPGEDAPPGTSAADAMKARDSVLFADSFQATRAAAEILSPGVQLPTYDSAAAPRKTYDALCMLRRKALDRANLTPEGRDTVEAVTGGRPLVLDGMSCGDVRKLFNASVALIRARNVEAAKGGHKAQDAKASRPHRMLTAAEINKANAEFYKNPSNS